MKYIVTWVVLLGLILVGCSSTKDVDKVTNESTTKEVSKTEVIKTEVTPDEKTVEESGSKEQIDDKEADVEEQDIVSQLIETMTIEEKVAQLFIVDFYGMTGAYHTSEVTQATEEFLGKYPVGGIIYFAENIQSSEQVTRMNDELQRIAKINMFIAIDEEGGLVSRLGKADIGVMHLESARKLADSYSSEEVYELAAQLGNQMNTLGFNYDFAPVFDVDTNPNNPVIGSRSFSDQVEEVAEYGMAFNNGLLSAGIVTSAKHYPGHGDTGTDSHIGIASVEHTLERLEEIELVPFIRGIEDDIASIMVGHISTPNITGDYTPASLSNYMIEQLLREELKYDGVVISDSFRMQAITDYYGASELGVLFLEAGGDIILIPEAFEETYTGILEAIKSGRLSEERIDESLRRILHVKLGFKIIEQ